MWMRQEPACESGLGLLAIRSSIRSVTRRKSRSAGMFGRCTSIVSCWALFQAVWLFAPLDIGTKHCTLAEFYHGHRDRWSAVVGTAAAFITIGVFDD